MAYLDAAAAETRLKNLTQWTSAPALSQAEITDLLLLARTTDEHGWNVDDEPYVTTYTDRSVEMAAAKGFDMKAAKVASEFDASTGGGTRFERSQQYKMLKQAARGLRGGGSSIGSIGLVR